MGGWVGSDYWGGGGGGKVVGRGNSMHPKPGHLFPLHFFMGTISYEGLFVLVFCFSFFYDVMAIWCFHYAVVVVYHGG